MSQRRIHDCPSLPGLSTSSRVAASCMIVAVVAQPFSEMTWWVRSGQGFSGKTASVLPACTICTSMSSGPRSILKATVNVVASLVLPFSWACFAADGIPIRFAAPGGGGTRSSSMLTTRSAPTACVSMSQQSLTKRRCALAFWQSRAEALLQALGGLLVAQAHAMQELSDPLSTAAHVETRCVEPFLDHACF